MDSSRKIPLLLLLGPTASGKTDLLASTLPPEKAEVINADAFQVYRELKIGTGKPDEALCRRIPHHLIDNLSYREFFSAGDFTRSAEELIRDIDGRRRLPILCGGTAFYLRSFLYGLDEIPPVPASVKEALRKELREKGTENLRKELERVDPLWASRIHPADTYRTVRGLEIFRAFQKPFSSFHHERNTLRPEIRERYRLTCIALKRPKQEQDRRIRLRVEAMFRAGLPEEIRRLREAHPDFPSSPAARGIGYREFFPKDARQSRPLPLILEEIQKNSRRYAKRQMTFFRSLKGLDIRWFHPEEEAEALRALLRSSVGLSASALEESENSRSRPPRS